MSREELLEELKKLADKALAKKPEERSYKERQWIWEYEQLTNPSNTWDEGEEIEILDGENLFNNNIKDATGEDFPEWFRKTGRHFGEKVEIEGEKYTLIGMSYTYRDYYYLLQDLNGNKTACSCVARINYLE